ncbi:hypothetical protein FE257_001999 [Aspergillus nanangensis]|uniref:Carboxylic ester hydrolase n=1 Tax=Aspergillus nanangensis TaxID=2582783 RepID=A0AAD4CTM2_ASPNN|nr:hypothetical protein FE257_001999 [Aspergillus nanangensis]
MNLLTILTLLYLFTPSLSLPNTTLPTATLHKPGHPPTLFVGRSLLEFNQDLFLGIKYADQPDRFTPSTLKASYRGNDSNNGQYTSSHTNPQLHPPSENTILYNATAYGNECPGYGSDTTTLVNRGIITLNEDCLNLNIIRPSKTSHGQLLPVMLWIFGGGWQQGATADPRYNMSYVVRQGELSGNAVLGVSINYRMAAFGFLDSDEVRAEGVNNLGLRDQRVAMRWVKDNIAAFGGDPDKITIWGESAGAYSVGAHLVANDGENEGLFRAAILESGNAVGPPWNGTDWHQPMYDRIVNKTGCTTATNTLQCLRETPYDTLYASANENLEWFGAIDGKFIKEYPQISLQAGRVAKVPILLGTNTDEGTSFGTKGTNTDEECVAQLISSKRWVLTHPQATKLITYYPNDPTQGCPYGWGNTTWPALGAMYKRYSSMAGDLTMAAPRRLLAQTMARQGVEEVYSYRWDVPALNESSTIGVGHFAEIPFVFANPDQDITPLGDDPARLQLGNLAARMWTAFVVGLDPNGYRGEGVVPQWTKYTLAKPTNFVFRLPREESYVEEDRDRVEGMEYINSIPR